MRRDSVYLSTGEVAERLSRGNLLGSAYSGHYGVQQEKCFM